jgi:hypothetical protein
VVGFARSENAAKVVDLCGMACRSLYLAAFDLLATLVLPSMALNLPSPK